VGGWAPWELILRVCHHWQIRHSINSQIGRKPWQGLLHRAPSKAEKEEPREMTQARARSANPLWVTKGQRNKLCSRALTRCKKHIEKEK